jgi:lipoprotein NlpI
MSTLAELSELVGFFSYSREDDEAFKGTLSALRDGIQRELSAQLGRSKATFRLWQDQAAIAPGKLWETEIKTAIDQSVFFIPIVTPRAVNSKYCKFEFETFLAREAAIGRNDLVFPIVYISVAALENEAKWRDDPVLSTIGRRQYVDWRSLRHLDAQTTAVREQIERLCQKIVEALSEPWVSPEERRRMEEAEAEARRLEAEAKRREEEEEQRRTEAEARQRAEEQARLEAEAKRREEEQRRTEAEARQRAEEQARLEAEAKRREEEEGQRRTEAEARQRAEKEARRLEAQAKRREKEQRRAEAQQRAEEEARWLEAEEQAFTAAKQADDVGALDAFLANYPESRHTIEAQGLREALVARDEACNAAMASDDAAVLKAFLGTYPNGSPAEQVRGRLRNLEPQTVWRPGPRRRDVAIVACMAFVVIGVIGLIIYTNTPPQAPEPAIQAQAPEPKVHVPQHSPLPTVADDIVSCKKASGDEAIRSCSHVITSGSVSPDDLVDAYIKRGNAYVDDKQDYDRAIADYSEAIKLDPKNAVAFYDRGLAYYSKQDYDHAIADYSVAIKLDPKDAWAFDARGLTYYDKQDFDRAIADYSVAIKLDPKNARVFSNRGEAYRAKQDFDRAIADFNEAVKLDPKKAAAFERRAAAYYAKQSYDRAIADDSAAIDLDPKYASAYFYRGLAYLCSGTLAKALADVSQASELDQKNAYIALWVDIIRQRNNLPSRLSEGISKIDMTTWPAPVIRMFLGQMTPTALLAAVDDPDANKKKGQACEANFYSGEMALRMGAKDEAARLFRLAARDCPKNFFEWPAANAELKALGVTR